MLYQRKFVTVSMLGVGDTNAAYAGGALRPIDECNNYRTVLGKNEVAERKQV
jgi:hypothetical protein